MIILDDCDQHERHATLHISEAFLLPVLASVLAQFPFVVLGFHSNNGSEYTNHQVAKLLRELLIEQTKSRSRQSHEREACPRGTTHWPKATMPGWCVSTWTLHIYRSAMPDR